MTHTCPPFPPLARRDFLRSLGLSAAALALGSSPRAASAAENESRWSPERAKAWQTRQPWRVGCNYIPASAENAIEMWQAATFDPERIDRELGWAAGIGMNALRVFLHDLVWTEDGEAFLRRLDTFLGIADRRGMATLFVFFDSCWDPAPRLGVQPPPTPGVHNSRWVQSPGAAALLDRDAWPRLQAYVTQVVSRFGGDRRVLGWDLWNEPDNLNVGSYQAQEPHEKIARIAELLPQVFDWARSAAPTQPLTSPLWQGDWAPLAEVSRIQRIQLTQSDVLSFHEYGPPERFEARVAELRTYGRPIVCTEYMARPLGSSPQAILPLARKDGVAAFNWGLVEGRTQTTLPWDSWRHPYTGEKPGWFHDLFRPDGQPYSADEVAEFRRETTGDAPAAAP